MEKDAYQREKQVWQRVRGEKPEAPLCREVLQGLILEELSASAGYLVLSRGCSGGNRIRLRNLFVQSHRHAVCLKGICTMLTGKRPFLRGTVPEKPQFEAILRQNYGRELRCLEAYERLSRDPEYGPVFSRLAEESRGHCRMILELIGESAPNDFQ